jgi:ABC-type multidrug transport system fused ATPase/permease subunit
MNLYYVFTAISVVVDCLVAAIGFYAASRRLHEGALYPLFRAPMSFFDANPLGRILNYFSTDMDTADLALPLDVQLWLIAVTSLLSTVITIAFAAPIFLAIIIPILIINAFVQVRTSFDRDDVFLIVKHVLPD